MQKIKNNYVLSRCFSVSLVQTGCIGHIHYVVCSGKNLALNRCGNLVSSHGVSASHVFSRRLLPDCILLKELPASVCYDVTSESKHSFIICGAYFFRSLSCQRITLHKNLFFSYVLNSVFTLTHLIAVVSDRDLVKQDPVSIMLLIYFTK